MRILSMICKQVQLNGPTVLFQTIQLMQDICLVTV